MLIGVRFAAGVVIPALCSLYVTPIMKIIGKKKSPEKYNNIKGAIELGSLAGSIIGLAIIAPQVSQALTRTVLKVVGLEKK